MEVKQREWNEKSRTQENVTLRSETTTGTTTATPTRTTI